MPQPARRIGGVATLRIGIAGNDEGLLRVGLYSETPVASETFALLAQGAYKDTTETTPAGVDGTTWRVDKPFCMYDTVRIKPGTGLPPADGLAQDARGLSCKYAEKNKTGGAINAAARRRFVCRQERPGPDLDFALSFAPSDGKGRYAVGALLDDASMKLLARLGSLPVVSSRAALGGKAGQPLVKVQVVDASFDNT